MTGYPRGHVIPPVNVILTGQIDYYLSFYIYEETEIYHILTGPRYKDPARLPENLIYRRAHDRNAWNIIYPDRRLL
jgi:hypothetical protein